MLLVVEIALVVVGVVVLLLLVRLVACRRRQAKENSPQRDERGMQKKKPYFRRDVVERKATSLFPDAATKETLDLLNAGLPTSFGLERLQLTLIKLSDSDLDELRRLVEVVTSDSGLKSAQDIMLIGKAESPEAERMSYEYLNLAPGDQEPIFQRDLRQYLQWVKQ